MAERKKPSRAEIEQESQLTEVRTCFGLAVYNAQLMEKQIINMFVAARLHTTHNITQAEIHEMFDIHFRENVGRLLLDLKAAYKFSASLHHQLDDAVKIRNILSRGFFRAREQSLSQTKGRMKVIEELEMASVVFAKINAYLKDSYHAYLTREHINPTMVESALRDIK